MSSDSIANGLHVANLDTEMGKVVVDLGLATRTEVDFCREQQKQSSDPNQRSLTDILIEHSFITVNQAKRIRSQLEERRKNEIPGYKLIKMVGKGAMASVYKAKQESLDRIVAVKVLPRNLADNREFVDRFYKEGRAAARLSHNNIVQAYDVGSTPEGFHYFVMEFIEGKTLYDVMQPAPVGDGKTFSEAEALDVMIQVTDAMVHAHERGLIHRDIKPKNILLTPQGVAKVTDLGLARAVDDHVAAESEAGKAYGTPYYISPEQIRGEVDIDFRTDIYSLGATLYHLVTGRPPFEGESPTAVMHKHLKEPLVPPDHINTALSAGISEIVEVAMAKKREDRYGSTADMLEDLKAVARNDPPIHARQTIDLDSLAMVEETGKTVDLTPDIADQPFWERSAVAIWLIVGLVVSGLLNVILILMMANR
jgi:eukaryotic-like serine/threonine-protein kinase